MNDTTHQGQEQSMPHDAEPQPGPTSIAAISVVLGATGKKNRESQVRYAIENDDLSSKLPNPVRLNPDPALLLNRRFFADAMQETRERPGVLVSGDDPNTFEFIEVVTLRTEAGDLYEPIKAEIDNLDPSRQLLLLTSRPIHLTEEIGGKKVRVAYHLLRMNLDRSHVVLRGIPLARAASEGPREYVA